MPFGRFLGRVADERALGGLTFARLVPTIPKREVQRHHHDEAHFVFVLRGGYETWARPAGGRPGQPLMIYNPPGTTHRDCFADEDSHGGLRHRVRLLSRLGHHRAGGAAAGMGDLPGGVDRRPGAQLLVETGGQDDLSECIAETLCLDLLLRTGVDRDRRERRPLLAPPRARPAARHLPRRRPEVRPRPRSRARRAPGAPGAPLPPTLRRETRRLPAPVPPRRARYRLLRRSPATLAAIATATGFTDQSHFTTAFRRSFGVSPGLFRRS